MERFHKTLAHGVELVMTQTNQFKTGVFSVTLTVPLQEETATAYALIPDVLYRGSRRHPDIESLSAATDELYGASLGPAVRQRGESQCLGFQCSFIDDRYALDGMAVLEPAIALVGEILLDPYTVNGVFDREFVSSEGANLADRIGARINDKRGWSIFRLVQEMCRGERYAADKLGDAQQARTMTAEELWQHYQTLLAQSHITFYYGGSAELERVEQAIAAAFAPLLQGREAPVMCQVLARPVHEAVQEVTDVLEVTQGKLALGFRTGGIAVNHPQLPALMVCNALYGGTAHSKLFTNVREKMSLCYFASSLLDKIKGLMVVSSGVEFSKFSVAKEAILAQLDAIRRGEFAQEELQAAIRSVVNALTSRKDSQGLMEDDCVTVALTGGDPTDVDDMARRVEQVTRQDVVNVAQRLALDTVYYLTGEEG